MVVPMSQRDPIEGAINTRERAAPEEAGAAPMGQALGDEPINILIVDDEPKNLVVLRAILECPEYRLVDAGSADEALLALIAQPFALLILDVRMPEMSGFELAEIIKERKKTARVPIIFLTAYYGEDQHVLDGYGAGAVDYLHKPVSPAILRSKVAVFAELYRKNREAQLSSQALLAEVRERRRADERLRVLNETLENRVIARTGELRESQARLSRAADLARLTYFNLDYVNDRMEVAENFADIMGFSLPSKLEGTGAVTRGVGRLSDRVAIADRGRFLAATRSSSPDRLDRIEYRVVGDDGGERWIESEWHVETGPDSRLTQAFVANLDITERRQSEERRKLLMTEVNHRSKNLLSVVQAMVTQSTRDADPRTFAQELSDRLQGLSASQNLLVENDWAGIGLMDLIQAQMYPFRDVMGTRVLTDGPAVRLTAAGSQSMGMALHELVTNATKYGSLSTDEGWIRISWEVADGEEPMFSIQWVEEGGPRVRPPTRRGFGHLVIGRIAEAALGGTVEWQTPESGVRWKLTAPAAEALEFR
jgi:two-component sensor histidine kinase/DNA-binding response OmpR family regulator